MRANPHSVEPIQPQKSLHFNTSNDTTLLQQNHIMMFCNIRDERPFLEADILQLIFFGQKLTH